MRDTCPERDARARVSKDEDEGLDAPSCFETHRSAGWVVEALALASRCDAPQHEGGGARAFWRNEPNEDASLLRAKNQPAAVENDRAPTLPDSRLFFTGICATETCKALVHVPLGMPQILLK